MREGVRLERQYPRFSPCGVITLTTDFGLADPFVGVMKGAILRVFPSARIVDLTHAVPAHWPSEAGFWLTRAAEYFPPGTVHVAVVDPGVGTSREILLVGTATALYLAPDNGLLGPVVDAQPGSQLMRLHPDRQPQHFPARVSATFHGRDLLAPAAALLASGQCTADDIAVASADMVPALLEEPSEINNKIEGVVVTIDHFGNLITNIRQRHLRSIVEPVIWIGGQRLPLRRTYGDVAPGCDLALINAFDALEIARAQGNAAVALGLERGAKVIVQDGVRHR
jgi:hypothetical protein